MHDVARSGCSPSGFSKRPPRTRKRSRRTSRSDQRWRRRRPCRPRRRRRRRGRSSIPWPWRLLAAEPRRYDDVASVPRGALRLRLPSHEEHAADDRCRLDRGCAPRRRHRRARGLGARLAWRARAAHDEVPFVTTPDAVTLAMLELAAVTRARPRRRPRLGRRPHRHHRGAPLRRERPRRRDRPRARAHEPRARARRRRRTSASSSASRTCSRPTSAPATVVTMYLLPDVNLQLRPRLLALAPGTRIVSHDWDLGDWAPDRTVTSTFPTRRSAATSSRASTCGSCRRACTAAGAPTARASRSCSASSASRRRSRPPAAPRRRRCSTAASRRRRCAARASMRSPCGSTARRSACSAPRGSAPGAAFVRAARRRLPVSGVALPAWRGDRLGALALSGARDRPHRRHRPARSAAWCWSSCASGAAPPSCRWRRWRASACA